MTKKDNLANSHDRIVCHLAPELNNIETIFSDGASAQ